MSNLHPPPSSFWRDSGRYDAETMRFRALYRHNFEPKFCILNGFLRPDALLLTRLKDFSTADGTADGTFGDNAATQLFTQQLHSPPHSHGNAIATPSHTKNSLPKIIWPVAAYYIFDIGHQPLARCVRNLERAVFLKSKRPCSFDVHRIEHTAEKTGF